MENKATQFHLDLLQAIQDENEERLNALLKERNDYVNSLVGTEIEEETLRYFIEKDKEITTLIEQKKNGLQQFLLTQNNQLKAVKKYEGF